MSKNKKNKFKYNLILLNESTLEEVFRIKTSKLTFSLALGFFTLISFTLLSIIIFVTPLKHMLPGYADVSVREDVLIEAQRIDSLETLTQNNERQLLIIKNIIADNIKFDSIPTLDTTDTEKWNNLPLIAGSAEATFVKQYEEENAFNVNGYNNYNNPQKESIVFIAPATGTITQHFMPNNTNNGITILCPQNTPILAPQDGHIILTNYHPNNGYTIAIQHTDGYISIFHQLSEKLCNIGAEVKVGEAIAFASSKNEKQETQIQYELWHNGSAINPEDQIVF